MTDGYTDPRHVSKKKNTNKWCKGIVGREHKLEMAFSKWPYMTKCHRYQWGDRRWLCRHEIVCSVCKKIVDRYLDENSCPDYDKEKDVK